MSCIHTFRRADEFVYKNDVILTSIFVSRDLDQSSALTRRVSAKPGVWGSHSLPQVCVQFVQEDFLTSGLGLMCEVIDNEMKAWRQSTDKGVPQPHIFKKKRRKTAAGFACNGRQILHALCCLGVDYRENEEKVYTCKSPLFTQERQGWEGREWGRRKSKGDN